MPVYDFSTASDPNTTTSWPLIRARYCGSSTARGIVEQLVPGYALDKGFERSKVRNKRLRDWADGKNSIQFRKFEWVRSGAAVEPNILHPERIDRFEEATLSIAYPAMPALYGSDDLDSMEDLIRSDARLVRDALTSVGNLITGLNWIQAQVLAPERAEGVWFQDLVCTLDYYEAQTLT